MSWFIREMWAVSPAFAPVRDQRKRSIKLWPLVCTALSQCLGLIHQDTGPGGQRRVSREPCQCLLEKNKCQLEAAGKTQYEEELAAIL